MVVQVNVNFQGEFYRKSGRSPRSYTNGPYSNGKRSIQRVPVNMRLWLRFDDRKILWIRDDVARKYLLV